ncbi:hypothetical protein F5148DRAFT_1310486 [Russula earlei]|uniref:Uncharacterized protein n=1 Tax=Russula earlei TaxID=71964 RepID=A0ACC0U6W3_9AGAM|nr:hypothetical protein F5148DRAFT_1310486 [Russula earlei]
MALALPSSLVPWLPTISALLLPFLLRLLPIFREPPSRPRAPAPLRSPISALLALYALYTLHLLAFARPPNIFTALRLPLNAPQSAIRAALARSRYVGRPATATATASASTFENDGGAETLALPPALERLLSRLASSDARTMLVRFGQRAVQTCAHCATDGDYALHALPPALLSYALAAAVLGAVTIRGTARESRRGIGLMLLVVAALVEAYWAYTVPVRIPSRPKHQGDDPVMWHDTLWSLRHALFLALPLSIHLLPAPPHTPPLSATLTHLHQTADAQLARLHFLRLSTSGVQRVPELRTRAAAFWARERTLGSAVRRDADVRAAAERAGLGIAPPEGRALLGSQDHAEAQKRTATARPSQNAQDGGGDGASGEGTLHRAARNAVAALKETMLRREESPHVGAQ